MSTFAPRRFIKTNETWLGLYFVTWAFCWPLAFCSAKQVTLTLIRIKKKKQLLLPLRRGGDEGLSRFFVRSETVLLMAVVDRIDCPLHDPSSMVCERRSLNRINRCEYCSPWTHTLFNRSSSMLRYSVHEPHELLNFKLFLAFKLIKYPILCVKILIQTLLNDKSWTHLFIMLSLHMYCSQHSCQSTWMSTVLLHQHEDGQRVSLRLSLQVDRSFNRLSQPLLAWPATTLMLSVSSGM